MTDDSSTDDESSTDSKPHGRAAERRVQDMLEESMPDFPEDRREMPDADDVRMTTDEQTRIHQLFDGLVHTLYDRGYSPSELGIIVNGLGHRMNASRYDPYEYDRIALSIRLRETIEEWRDDQPEEIPPLEIAEVVEELGRHYRDIARKDLYQSDSTDDTTETDTDSEQPQDEEAEAEADD